VIEGASGGSDMQGSTEIDERSSDPAGLEPSHRRSRRMRTCLAVVASALVAAGGLAWWSGTGGRIGESGGRLGMPLLTVGHTYYVRYDIPAVHGDVQIDAVRLADEPEAVDVTFTMATGPCAIGATASVPDGCDLVAPHGVTVAAGQDGVLIAAYTLREPGTFEMGDVVVRYHSGLHRRQQHLGLAVCLTTASDTSSCPNG
jgi:hypothetical protein